MHSNPANRTKSSQASLELRRLFCCTNKSLLRFVSLKIFSAIHFVTAEDRALLARTMVTLGSSAHL